jgi:hypothetical protein
LRLWYNGHEVLAEFSGWGDLGRLLADSGAHEDWNVFESAMAAHDKISAGALSSESLRDSDPGEAVLKAILAGEEPDASELLATALRRALAE